MGWLKHPVLLPLGVRQNNGNWAEDSEDGRVMQIFVARRVVSVTIQECEVGGQFGCKVHRLWQHSFAIYPCKVRYARRMHCQIVRIFCCTPDG